jgi:hypothetical protein
MASRTLFLATGMLIASLGGCGTSPSIQASAVQARAGKGVVVVSGANLPPSRPYNIGVHTFWSPLMVGAVRTDLGGSISPTTVAYSCETILGSPVDVGFYEVNGLAKIETAVAQSCGPNLYAVARPAQP